MSNSEKEIYNEIGKAIKEARKQLGFTMQDFADKTKLSQSAISMIENGIRHPSIPTLVKFSQELGVDFLSMLSNAEPEEFALQTPVQAQARTATTLRPVQEAIEITANDFIAHLQIAQFECTIDVPDFHQPIYEALQTYITKKFSEENTINELNALMKEVKKDIVLKKEEELIRLRSSLLDE